MKSKKTIFLIKSKFENFEVEFLRIKEELEGISSILM